MACLQSRFGLRCSPGDHNLRLAFFQWFRFVLISIPVILFLLVKDSTDLNH